MPKKTENIVIRYYHSSPGGDLIAILAALKHAYKETGKRAIIYQQINNIGISYQGAEHPFSNANGDPVLMNQQMFDNLERLVSSQDYIAGFYVYNGQEFDVDLNKIRLETFTNQPHGSLHRWVGYAFPQMSGFDLSKQWLYVSSSVSRGTYQDKLLINFTLRHRNNFVNYFFLKQYEDKLLFSGLPKEHQTFCLQWNLKIPLLETENFLELASIMQSCKGFLGNASCIYHISESIKVPRILETFQLMPNCIPFGENGYDFYHQGALDFYVKKLMS